MSENLMKLAGARNVRASEPDAAGDSAVAPRDDLPASDSEARDRANGMIGVVRPAGMYSLRQRWWDRLACAITPEEKLACQWMIDALAYAAGMADHERGARLVQTNQEALAKQSDLDRRERALARWR